MKRSVSREERQTSLALGRVGPALEVGGWESSLSPRPEKVGSGEAQEGWAQIGEGTARSAKLSANGASLGSNPRAHVAPSPSNPLPAWAPTLPVSLPPRPLLQRRKLRLQEEKWQRPDQIFLGCNRAWLTGGAHLKPHSETRETLKQNASLGKGQPSQYFQDWPRNRAARCLPPTGHIHSLISPVHFT